jgi:hypothetical protein
MWKLLLPPILKELIPKKYHITARSLKNHHFFFTTAKMHNGCENLLPYAQIRNFSNVNMESDSWTHCQWRPLFREINIR